MKLLASCQRMSLILRAFPPDKSIEKWKRMCFAIFGFSVFVRIFYTTTSRLAFPLSLSIRMRERSWKIHKKPDPERKRGFVLKTEHNFSSFVFSSAVSFGALFNSSYFSRSIYQKRRSLKKT